MTAQNSQRSALTVENQTYGGGYQPCARCGVMRRPSDRTGDACTDAVKCAEWKATLKLATPADVHRAAEQLAAKGAGK